MANNTIPQTARNGLPEKKWFTLDEVATRWKGMTGQAVSVEDVLHYGAEGLLRISYNYSFAIPTFIEAVRTESGLRYQSRRGLPEKGPFGLSAIDIGRVAKGDVFTPDSVLPDTVLTYNDGESSVVYTLPGFDMYCPDRKVDNTIKIERLIVTREELERFEQAHDIGQAVF
jgi:hypothetical protein